MRNDKLRFINTKTKKKVSITKLGLSRLSKTTQALLEPVPGTKKPDVIKPTAKKPTAKT